MYAEHLATNESAEYCEYAITFEPSEQDEYQWYLEATREVSVLTESPQQEKRETCRTEARPGQRVHLGLLQRPRAKASLR